jgi:hypothetical protein
MPAAAPQQMSIQQQNMLARQHVLANAIDEWNQIFQQTFNTGTLPGTIINIPIRNVGLIKRFIVQVAAIVSGSAGVTHTLTNLGVSNFFSNVILTDLSNQTRINTAGWHLVAVASAKARMPYGSAITATDTPFGYGNNFKQTISAPPTITASAAANNVFGMFEIPVAYSDQDLRGGIFANVVNATLNLQLTVNPNLLVASGVDATFAMYQSSSATVATITSFTVTVFQNYLDQIPVNPKTGNPILPLLDLSTAYLLNNTSFSGLVANQDNPLPYANFRNFMSTTLIYDNAGVLTANGADISYFAIQSANYTNIFKYNVQIASLFARLRLQSDFPPGMYYFDHRNRPINTIQYGNMSLIVNPSTVTGATSTFYVGYEALAIINQVTNAGSLAGS